MRHVHDENGSKGETNLDFLVCSYAGEDTLSHSSDDAGGIADGFVDTDLDVVLAEENSLSSKERGSGLGGNTGASAPFREQESN